MKCGCLVVLLLAQFGVGAQPFASRFDSLEKVRGIHPRLYLDAARVAELRQAIQTSHASLWKELRQLADRDVRRGPPAYAERDNRSGDEQLWQREVGNAMPVLAMAWALSGERQYLEAAHQWALASCGYRTWGLGQIDGLDLAAGHQLLGLGLVLRFHPESRQATREGNAFVMRGARSCLRLEPLVASSDVNLSAEDLPIEGREGERSQTMFTVRLSKEAAVWRNAVALSWSSSGQRPKPVQASLEGEAWRFSVAGRVVTLDWKDGTARLEARSSKPPSSPRCASIPNRVLLKSLSNGRRQAGLPSTAQPAQPQPNGEASLFLAAIVDAHLPRAATQRHFVFIAAMASPIGAAAGEE